MFDFAAVDPLQQMKDSPSYKLIRKGGRLYVIDERSVDKSLIEHPHGAVWEQSSALVVDAAGRVEKNRFGPTTWTAHVPTEEVE